MTVAKPVSGSEGGQLYQQQQGGRISWALGHRAFSRDASAGGSALATRLLSDGVVSLGDGCRGVSIVYIDDGLSEPSYQGLGLM